MARDPTPAVVIVALALGLMSPGCGPDGSGEPLVGDVHRRLLLDRERVELVEGFGDYTELFVEHDLLGRFNPDRDELPVPVLRDCTLRWHVDARPGRFVARVARLHVGPQGDESGGTLSVVVTPHEGAGAATRADFALPAVPERAAADPHRWREGPATDVRVELPAGAATIELVLSSTGEVPPGAGVALLSPRVEQLARPLPPRLTFAESDWLLDDVVADEGAPRLFARRQVQGPADAPVEDRWLSALQVVGAFEGQGARHALALTGDGRWELPLGDARAGDRLRTALALDRRLPPGTRARLEVSLDGRPLVERTLTSSHWTELDVELPTAGEVLGLALATEVLEPAPVVVVEPDFALGDFVDAGYRAEQVRVGLAELRIERERAVPWRRASAARPSVIVLHVETLRADLLDATAADGRPLMPNLRRLAGLGTWYRRAHAPSPWTLPSTATLLTGLYPSAHGVRHHDRSVMPTGAPTLAERARAAGVSTLAIATNDLLDPHKGYDRGFRQYAYVPLANARQVHALTGELLANHAGRQFLLFVHGWDPHHPWRAPLPHPTRTVAPEFGAADMDAATARATDALVADRPLSVDDPDMRFLRQTYEAEASFWDHYLGALLDELVALGLDATTSVVVTSDHGEEFGEHGLFGHGSQLFDESTHVPLVVIGAGGWGAAWTAGADDGGRTVERVVSTAGLHAEVLEWLDVPYDAEAVRPALSRDDSGLAYIETDKGIARGTGRDPLRRRLEAARGANGLLIRRHRVPEERVPGEPDFTLWAYDLASDPGARQPLPEGAPLPRSLAAALDRAATWAAAHRQETASAGADADMLQKLLELGYVQGQGEAVGSPQGDPAPGAIDAGRSADQGEPSAEGDG